MPSIGDFSPHGFKLPWQGGREDDMDNWKTLLADVDDDYLAGMANKGIVKRAYKDKEEGDYQILSWGEEAKVRTGDKTVSLRIPLGESGCSCPSRSVCRHIVLSILVLKEHLGKEDTASKEAPPLKEAAPPGQQEKVQEEIAAYPFLSIKKILGGRQLQILADQAKAGKKPKITYGSVVTVEVPGQGERVKLLSPLAYSACTCHKKEMCIHKAAALLWCKLEGGQLTIKELEEVRTEKQQYDWELVREAAGQMKTFLEELFNTGLARTSPEVLESMERLALVSHRAQLASFEGYWRSLREAYESYLGRKASFRIQHLTQQLARLYQRAELLLNARDGAEISLLAGEFKAQYTAAEDLDLIGIAMEHFENQAGYQGETVYFLEEHTKEWYTYTSARPVFYEKSGRRGRPEKAGAPWGLPLSLEELARARFHLSGVKTDGRGRLSASQETKGELTLDGTKKNRIQEKELGGWYYQDFGRLFEEQIDKKRQPWLKGEKERQELVFLRPASFERAFFSQTQQKLFMRLLDEQKREVMVEVAYSKQEAWGIRYLERIREDKQPCFLGKIYLREGRIRMYPVAVFEKEELA